MKKTLIRVLLLVGVFSLLFAVAASAKQELPLTANLSTSYTDGGYYMKGNVFDLSAADGGVKVAASVADRCLWAFTNETIDAYPYLTYELPDGGAVYKMTVSRCWDVEPEIELDVKPGKHTINLKEVLSSHKTTVGYSYVVVYVEGEAVITGFALSDTDGSAEQEVPGSDEQEPPATADSASVVAVIAVLSAVAVVTVCKKHR